MKARRVKGLDADGPLIDNMRRVIVVRVDELFDFIPDALDPEKVEQLHDMRIAAKRLRYLLELSEPLFGAPAKKVAKTVKGLQDILGEIHDCDVMLPRVRRHLKELQRADAAVVRAKAGETPDLDPRLAARAPHRTAYRGLDVLAVYLEARRRLLSDRFVAFWREQEETGTWLRLERSVEKYLQRAREARRAAKQAAKAQAELESAERARREAAERAKNAEQERERARLSATRSRTGAAARRTTRRPAT